MVVIDAACVCLRGPPCAKRNYQTVCKVNLVTMLLTSAYWPLGTKARSFAPEQSYLENFANTTAVHANYCVYAPTHILPVVHDARKEIPFVTQTVQRDFSWVVGLCEDAWGGNVLARVARSMRVNLDKDTETHAPSAELVLIWLAKVLLVQESLRDPSNSHYAFHGWIDLGYRPYAKMRPPQRAFPTSNLTAIPPNVICVQTLDCACHRQYFSPPQHDCVLGGIWYGDVEACWRFTSLVSAEIGRRLEDPETHSVITEQDIYTLVGRSHRSLLRELPSHNYELLWHAPDEQDAGPGWTTAFIIVMSTSLVVANGVACFAFFRRSAPRAFLVAVLATSLLVTMAIVFFAKSTASLLSSPAIARQQPLPLRLSSRRRPYLFLCWPEDILPERAHRCIKGTRIFNADTFEVVVITASNLGDFVASEALAEWRSSPDASPEQRCRDMRRRLLRCCGGVALPACCISFAPLREVLLLLRDETLLGYDQEGRGCSAVASLLMRVGADYSRTQMLSTDLVDLASRRNPRSLGRRPPSALILDVEGTEDALLSLSWRMAQDFSASRMACNVEACYALNLDSRPDRWESVLEEFSLHFAGTARPLRQSAPSTPENGALGCLQGHLAMVRRAAREAPRKNVLILEDDAQALRDVRSALEEFFSETEGAMAWDVLLLAANVLEEEVIAGSVVNRARDVQTTAAYIVRAGYVSTLADSFSRALRESEIEGGWRKEFCSDMCWKPLQRRDRWLVFKDCVFQQRPGYSDIVKKEVDYGRTCYGRTCGRAGRAGP